MNRAISKIISLPGTIIHWLVVPLFAFVFCLYYRPFFMFDFLSMENTSFSFNSTILLCIHLVTLSITRWGIYLIGRFRYVTGIAYLLWCLGETIVSSLFFALYLVLISHTGYTYFEIAGISFSYLLTTTIYPLGILWLCFDCYIRNQDADKPVDESSLIRFYDEYKKLRLVIANQAVIFVRSEENYVQIHYLDKDKAKKFVLRSSMKALEDNLSKKGLVRCHRSYFINPSCIKMVHRDESGQIVAELNQDGFDSIPISRKYQNEITRLL